MYKSKRKKDENIEINLIFNSSDQEKSSFGLLQALNILISEKDVRDYLLNKKIFQQKKKQLKV